MTIKIKDISWAMIGLLVIVNNIALADEVIQSDWRHSAIKNDSFETVCQNWLLQHSGLLVLFQHNHQKLDGKLCLEQAIYIAAIG